ncbi:MAG: MSMEG_4193 family putative phosphomutase [Caldilineales bacterium]|nr:MSMEG_4193 family putative phosphomutase [Caldilineales bacterium]
MTSETAPAQPSPPPITTILLVRHGENDWVKTNKLAGRTPGVHLNESGRAQSRRLSARLAAWPIVAVYSSPLERCVETAEILAVPHRLAVQLNPDLLEADYGDWQGQEIDALKSQDLWKVIQRTPSFANFPGGESMRHMQSRMVDAMHAIVAAHPSQIVVVCSHADLIKAALAHYLGMHFDQFQRLHVSPASVSIIHFSPSGPHVSRVNDTGELGPPRPPQPESKNHV